MTVRTSIDLTRRFSVQAPLAQVFALLSDVPASARHFPQLERLVDLGGGVYRWQMQKVGAPPVLMQITYDCLYVADADCGTVRWTPAGGTGSTGGAGAQRLRRFAPVPVRPRPNRTDPDPPGPATLQLRRSPRGAARTAATVAR